MTARSAVSRTTVSGGLLVAVLVVLGLIWAKWWPYADKLGGLADSNQWSGESVLDAAGDAGLGPSLRGGWEFTWSYGTAVWKALLVALIVAAAVDALLPRRLLARMLAASRKRGPGALLGGLLSLPCMMCTCCATPIAATLRRNGASTSSALAYWVGNPTLNPAVLAFLALVAPWQWTITRLAVGILLVFVATAIVARLTRSSDARVQVPVPEVDEPPLRGAPLRFLKSLGRLTVTLVPEYLVVVFALGVFRGWLLPLDGSTVQWGIAAVVIAAVLGTLVVIPTAGEIPIIQALTVVGASAGVTGALLISLPAISVVSVLMIGRQLSWRVTLLMAAAVVACSLLAALMVTVLS